MTLALNPLDAGALASSVGLAGLVLVVFAETGLLIGFFLPGDSLLFLVGAYSATDAGAGYPHFDLPWALAGVAVAAVLGAHTGYLIGRRAGPLLFNRPDSRLFKQDNVVRTRAVLDRYGYGKALVLARFVPVVRTFMNPVAGVVGVPLRVFTLYNVAGGLVWSVGVTLLGYALGRTVPIDHYIVPITVGIVLLSVVPVAAEHRRRRQRPAQPPVPAREPDAVEPGR